MNFFEFLLNTAGIWFLFKIIEGLPIALYDIYIVIIRIRNCLAKRTTEQDENRAEEQSDNSFEQGSNESIVEEEGEGIKYDRTRGKLEYVLAGEGFLKFSLLPEKKKLFWISTLLPLFLFVGEMMSFYFGLDEKICQGTTDSSKILAPGLELFGRGELQTSVEELFNQSIGAVSSNRVCVTWPSSNNGVEYEASLCGSSPSGKQDLGVLLQFTTPGHFIGHFLPKNTSKGEDNYLTTALTMPFQESISNATLAGSGLFDAEVSVNGKGTLRQDVTTTELISEDVKKQIRKDFERFEELLNVSPAKYYEDEVLFGFLWDNIGAFKNGSEALVLSVLAQATRTPLRPAGLLSSENLKKLDQEFDTSCQEDFKLSKRASGIIIGVALLLHVFLVFLPSSISSIQYALLRTKENNNADGRN